jgi:hypothetical protein
MIEWLSTLGLTTDRLLYISTYRIKTLEAVAGTYSRIGSNVHALLLGHGSRYRLRFGGLQLTTRPNHPKERQGLARFGKYQDSLVSYLNLLLS